MKNKNIILIIILWELFFCINVFAINQKRSEETMRAIIRVENKVYNVKFYKTKAAKDLYNMLPLKLKLSDYAGAEKVSSINNKFDLDISDSPSSDSGKVGNISFYAPWGNLAFFYRQGPYAKGLINLAEIEEGGEWLMEYKNDFEIIIEKK